RQQVDQVVVDLAQLEIAVLQLIVDGGQFFVAGLDFLLGSFQLFIDALQFFVGGLHFLVGGLQLFVGGLLLLDDGLEILAGGGVLLVQADDWPVLGFRKGFGFLRLGRGGGSGSNLYGFRARFLEKDEEALVRFAVAADRDDFDIDVPVAAVALDSEVFLPDR